MSTDKKGMILLSQNYTLHIHQITIGIIPIYVLFIQTIAQLVQQFVSDHFQLSHLQYWLID